MEEQLIIAVQGFLNFMTCQASPHYFDSNKRNNAESAADGCLATTDASGAQPPERFGKKEKAARLAISSVLGAICEPPKVAFCTEAHHCLSLILLSECTERFIYM